MLYVCARDVVDVTALWVTMSVSFCILYHVAVGDFVEACVSVLTCCECVCCM